MNVQFQPDFRTAERRLPFECVALVLQGGGALGAYQAGVYEALAEANINPDWVAGVSIGAINSAIIAGNEPAERVAKLRAFWQEITANPLLDWVAAVDALTPKGHLPRALFNQLSATYALVAGAAGFFTLRQPPPWLHPNGALEATSFYETKLLKSTLERLVDFDRINAGEMRFSVGAVNVRTGNFVYFDNETHTIRAEHVMASGSLPPGFPAVEIEGEFYWDGGLISNTPLQWVVEQGPRQDTLAFQVDLWSARGELSGQFGRRRDAPEGNPISRVARAPTPISSSSTSAPERRSRAFSQSCPRTSSPARKRDAELDRRPEGLQPRPADLPLQAL